jgi:hypothetical protein
VGHAIQEFMRGSIVEWRQISPIKGGYLKWHKDIVWGITTDNNERDALEIGKFGCHGLVDLQDIRGVEITEVILDDYGFIRVETKSDLVTYYRDDFGYVKLDVYGLEHVYMKGKCIQYLHNFQRIFFDYTGRTLVPKISERPKSEFKSKYVKQYPLTASEMLKSIEELKLKGGSIDLSDIPEVEI